MAVRNSRSARALPVFPCVCFGLGLVLLFINLIGSTLLPEATDAQGFVGGMPRQAGLRRVAVQREYKPTAADRGTPEYEEYMNKRRAGNEAAWDSFSRGGYDSKIGEGWGNPLDAMQKPPAPAPAPVSAPAPAPAPAQAASGSSEGGNPFQFLVDLFQGTTTTTTTTPPPSPFESFLQMFQR
eukprot:TRINITY_DN75641_c0_g1_i1.p1 TRINITY_DN75641_c0_g1~~TRINITY_DN75641_c0_g1_i1.p1  ORF type:complete len:182 (-),score=33.94 TRINITY_DN75641_c0_g1_i1:297-842(-)